MEYELDAARATYYVMRELVAHHPGGTSNERSLATRLHALEALSTGPDFRPPAP